MKTAHDYYFLLYTVPEKKSGTNSNGFDLLELNRSQIEMSRTLKRTSKRHDRAEGSEKLVPFEML